MFVLAEIQDFIRIPPWKFQRPLKDAIAEELNKKLANKVVMNVGLCIALWDITYLGDSHIIPGDGSGHTKVHFRYVVFRPFMTEILIGKVKSCNRDGVTVTLGFFDDINIPSSALQHPSRFDEVEQVWVWEYQVDDEKHDLFMDIGETIRFRVTTEIFEETSPSGPENTPDGETSEPKVPYTLTASINEPGTNASSDQVLNDLNERLESSALDEDDFANVCFSPPAGNENNSEERRSEQEFSYQEGRTAEHDNRNTGREYICDICNKCFNEMRKLTRHSRTVHSEAKHKCKQCDCMFARADHLSRHVTLTHDDKKKKLYKCKYCNKLFSLKQNRNVHESHVHVDTALFQCENCGKSFKNKLTFKSHSKIHADHKIPCNFCRKTFVRKISYKQHMLKKHSTVSPIQNLIDSVGLE